MATITTDTFLDVGSPRTAWETWTMNGATLTIRTDTRWHAQAPASMTGSIGSTTISSTLGWRVLIDARNVRWLAYNSGTGTVPAINTSITQWGVTGILLGVWANLTSAPTVVWAAMPTTGFLKFREVSGGGFTAWALTGIGASATGADVLWWIEVAQDQAVSNTVPRLGKFETKWWWFYLDNTNGTAGQIFQVPTNGGGAGTHVPWIQIETGVWTDVYEWYPSVLSATFIAGNFWTDVRSKVCETLGNGQVRIGNNGTVNVWFLPPSWCRVRIPNILWRQCTTAARATNQVPNATLTTRPDFVTTSAGDIDFEYFMNDWSHLFSSPYRVRHVNCATFDNIDISNCASPIDIDSVAVGNHTGTFVALNLTSNFVWWTIQNSKFFRTGAAAWWHACSMTACIDFTFTNCHFWVYTFARNTGRSINTSQCLDCTFNDCYQYNSQTTHNTSFRITHNWLDHNDRFVGNTNATSGIYAVQCLTSCDNILVNNLTFGMKGVVTNFTPPYLGLYASTNCSNLTFRNAGTRAVPLRVENVTNAPGAIFIDFWANASIRVQRCYLQFTRTSVFTTINTSKNITMESLHGTVGSLQTLSLNTLAKGVRATDNSVTGGASVYGSHYFDMFTADTTGRLWFAMNEPTSFSSSYVSLVLAWTTGGFTSAGSVAMPTINDRIILETPYFIKWHTWFQNIAPTITGTNTGNFTYEYQIDTGTGYGTYKTLNATNLSGETISPSTGYKIRLRITTATANTTNALTYIRLDTTSTLVAQTNNLYPLDLATITLTGYTVGTRIQIFDTTNNVELYNAVPASWTLVFETEYIANFNVRIRAMYMSGLTAKEFVEFTDTVTASGLSRTISQTDDAVYIANAVNGSTVTGITIDDAALLIETELWTYSWQEIYAYETYWLSTIQGIRDEWRFIEAIDQANYKIFDFKIKNVSSPSVPLTITWWYWFDSATGNAIDIIDTTGGTIFTAPDRVVPFATWWWWGGGDTKEDIYTYFTTGGRRLDASISSIPASVRTELSTELGRIDVSTSTRASQASVTALPTLTTIEWSTILAKEATANSAKIASESVDAKLTTGRATNLDNLNATISSRSTLTAPQVRTELATELGRIDTNISSRSTLTAPDVRSELSTELWRIDVATSTRLATAGYTAPDNTGISSLNTKLTTTRANNLDNLDVAVSSVWLSPSQEAKIDAIKAKTDNLPADPASNTQVNTRLASSSYTPAPSTTDIWTHSTRTLTVASGLTPSQEAKIDSIVSNTDSIPSDVWTHWTRTLTVASGLTPSQEAKIDDILAQTDSIPNDVWTHGTRTLTVASGLTPAQETKIDNIKSQTQTLERMERATVRIDTSTNTLIMEDEIWAIQSWDLQDESGSPSSISLFRRIKWA